MDKKYNVAAYLRLSQEDDDKDVSDSIVSQKNIIDNKIKELGENFYLKDYYIDDGYTGLNTNRPGFQKMLLDIENGKINTIITKDLSRLSRNSFEANYYIELYFLERNIRYISVLDNVDTGIKNSNNDMIQFKTLINDWYSKDISRKIKSSVWARKEKGMFLGAIPPYGYRKNDKDKHKLVVNKREAIIVKRIFEEYNNGKTINQIIKGLQQDKIASPNNNNNNGEIRYKWREETIKRMLCNKVYLGHVEYGKRINLSYKSKKVKYIPPDEWKIVYNMHEAIVSKELFDNVQNKRNMNKTIKRKKHEWNLNGLVKCKECGAKMTLKVEYNKIEKEKIKSKKICCLNGLKKYRGKNCIKGSKGFNEEILNEIVSKSLQKIINKNIDKERLKNMINNEYCKENKEDKNVLNKELKKIEEGIKILYSDYKNELLDEEDYKKFYKEKINQRDRIKDEIKLCEKSTKDLSEEKLNNVIKEVFDMICLKKDIVLNVIDNIQIDNDNNVYINYKINFCKNSV